MVVTNDNTLADRVALIRNHAESVVGGMGIKEIANMIGFNFRMTEIEAAIAHEQLDPTRRGRRRKAATGQDPRCAPYPRAWHERTGHPGAP